MFGEAKWTVELFFGAVFRFHLHKEIRVSEREREREDQGPVPLHSPTHCVVSSKPELLGFVKAAAKPLGIVKVLPRFSDLSKALN